jgi:hypothetical protein
VLEELPTLAVLHDDAIILFIPVGLVELDDVWVVDLHEDQELFLQHGDFLIHLLSGDGFDSINLLWVRPGGGEADCPEVAGPQQLSQLVDFLDVLMNYPADDGLRGPLWGAWHTCPSLNVTFVYHYLEAIVLPS